MARYLIDTDVMIDVSRGIAAAATFVDSLEDITISIITAHELIVGARNQRDAAAIDGLIRTFPVHGDLRAEITGLAYDLLKKHAKSDGLRTFDALIAATAIVEGFTLVSRNRKHFQDDRRPVARSAELLTTKAARPLLPSTLGSTRRRRMLS